MIYLVAPNATHPSGGVGVAAQWVRLLIEHGHEAMFITPNGDPSPYWLNFTVPSGSYADMKDEPGNKRVDIWMDCMMENQTQHMGHYFFAQDVCQLEHIKKEKGVASHAEYVIKLITGYKLITIGTHSKNFYLYRYTIPSKVVNNWVDTNLFNKKFHRQVSIGMMNHRDHFNPEIKTMLEGLGWRVSVAQGTQTEIAEDLGYRRYFISDVRGRFDGFNHSEGFPMPIAEAMAAGCVVLCRDTGGVREYVLDRVNGLFYKDISEIPALLEWAEAHPHFSDLSDAAQNTMHEKFTRENAWKQIQEALELK